MAAAAVPELTTMQFPDGTGSIGVAAGWTPRSLGQGQAVLVRPDGAMVSMGVFVVILDPNGPLYRSCASNGVQLPPGVVLPYPASAPQGLVDVAAAIAKLNGKPDPQTRVTASQPRPAGGTLVAGTNVIDGTQRQFSGIVGLSPPGTEGWYNLLACMVSGPDATFARDLPTMQAMYNSYAVNADARQKQLEKSSADAQAAQTDTFNRSMELAKGIKQRTDQSTQNFIQGTFHD